jgi:hypothetical protein
VDELFAFIIRAWPFAAAAAPGVFAGWQVWRNARRDNRKDRADLVKIAQEAAGSVIADLREDNDRARAQLDDIRSDFDDFRKAHDLMIADKDAELAMLRGENRQLKAALESRERLLAANGIPYEPLTQAIWQVPAGRAGEPKDIVALGDIP